MTKVAIFGTGYVGCVSAACLARDGHQVVGVDVDPHKVALINSGQSPVAEPGLPELIQQQVDEGRLTATTDATQAVQQSDICLIAVGTPSTNDGSSNLESVLSVVRLVGSTLRGSDRPYTVVLRSTLLPDAIEEQVAPALFEAAGRSEGDGIALCNNPEFLRETTAVKDYYSPPFVLVGSSDSFAANPVLELYDQLDCRKVATDRRTAALVKYASNAFHALKVGFANEIGALSRALGADGQEVMELVCMDTQLNVSTAYLRPGFAFGGSCLPKDVRALARFAQQQAIRANLIDSILPSNTAHLERAFNAIEGLGTKKIGVVGLSFKAGTDDLRESPQVVLTEMLLGRGYDIRIFDPEICYSRLVGKNLSYVEQHLPHLSALLVENAEDVFDHAELLILATDVADELHDGGPYPVPVFDLRRDLVAAERSMSTSA